jgi:hypothetical protein
MPHALRPNAGAKVAVAGAGLVAVAAALAPQLTGARAHDVALASGSGDLDSASLDLAGPWEHALGTADDNAQTVFGAADEAHESLLNGLTADTGSVVDNLETAWQAATLIDAPDELTQEVVKHTVGGTGSVETDPDSNEQPDDAGDNVHGQLYDGLVGNDPDEYQPPDGDDSLADLVNVMASPLSGVITGVIGPAVAPGVALFNSVDSALDDLTGADADPQAALGDLVNAPANMVDALFNGASLDLDPLVPVVDEALLADDDTEDLQGLSLGFGGLFSPGDVQTGVGGEENGVGGSLLNSIGFTLHVDEPQEDGEGYIGTMHAFDDPVGPIGAVAGLEDIIGQVFGGDLIG